MRLNIDLMAIPGAEQIEYGGVKGVFIPEVPNYRHFNKRGSIPERAIIAVNLYKTKTRSQKYDHVGQMMIYPEYAEAFLTNPRTVSRHRYVAYGYSWYKGDGDAPKITDASDFDRILEND